MYITNLLRQLVSTVACKVIELKVYIRRIQNYIAFRCIMITLLL